MEGAVVVDVLILRHTLRPHQRGGAPVEPRRALLIARWERADRQVELAVLVLLAVEGQRALGLLHELE